MKSLLCWTFLAGNELVNVSEAQIPEFVGIISEDEILFPVRLYEIFRGTRFHGLVCIQLLCALEIFS